MKYMRLALTALALTMTLGSSDVLAQRGGGGGQEAQEPMSFFITSTAKGDGANLGGLAGADAHCQMLAAAAGRGGATWHAYLSTQGAGAVNARDRIGSGPWHNANGDLIAANVADLHGDVQRDRNQINRDAALDENGERINGRGDQPNQHDILTGSDSHGRAFTDAEDHTCGNYTSGADGAGSAQLGHHDRSGGGSTSWNSAHGSRGCSQQNLVRTGGNGYLYCFASN